MLNQRLPVAVSPVVLLLVRLLHVYPVRFGLPELLAKSWPFVPVKLDVKLAVLDG